jgi:hypothetical protein
MNLYSAHVRFAARALAALAFSGCMVNSGPGADPGPGSGSPSPSIGAISVLSSIQGTTQASQCGLVGATDLELAVYEGSSHYTTVTAPCSDFQITVNLPEGDFNADVTLIDSHSQAVSTTLTLEALRVIAGTDLKVEVDFPASSILP